MKQRVMNFAICVLAAAALCLLVITMQSELNAFFSPKPNAGERESGVYGLSPLTPAYAVIQRGDETVQVILSDAAAFKSHYIETLGSAGVPVERPISDWAAVLEKPGILLDYIFPLPMAVISDGVQDAVFTMHASCVYLAAEAELVHLYVTDGKTLYMMETAARSENLKSLTAELSGTAVRYVHSGSLLTEHSLLYTTDTDVSTLRFAALTAQENILLSAFHFNPNLLRTYRKQSGEKVFLSDYGALYLHTHAGTVRFASESDTGIPLHVLAGREEQKQADYTYAALRIVSQYFQVIPAVQYYVPSGVTWDGETVTVSVSAYVDGKLIVWPSGGDTAACFVFTGGYLTAAEFYIAAVEKNTEQRESLPRMQSGAVAAVLMAQQGVDAGQLLPVYSFKETVGRPRWLVIPKQGA